MKTGRLSRTVLILIITAAATTASAKHVYVGGKATGCFGNADTACKTLVTGIAVSGPGTITISASGRVKWGGGAYSGPNGRSACIPDYQKPLQEAQGIAHGCVKNVGALFGVFVAQSWVQQEGFQPFDATKNLVQVGIKPGGLILVGRNKKLQVKEAGTLFLGINDDGVQDNGGRFSVNITFSAY